MTRPTDPGSIRSQIRQIAADPDLDAPAALEHIRQLVRGPVRITIGTHDRGNPRRAFAKRQGATKRSENARVPVNVTQTRGSHQT